MYRGSGLAKAVVAVSLSLGLVVGGTGLSWSFDDDPANLVDGPSPDPDAPPETVAPEPEPAPTSEPEPEPAPTSEPEPEPAPTSEPEPERTFCQIITDSYLAGGGSLDPAVLAGQGGLGQDIAACNGISLAGQEQPGAGEFTSPPCGIAESAITSKYGPNPTREQLLSEGGLGSDYAACKGISLADPGEATEEEEQETDTQSQASEDADARRPAAQAPASYRANPEAAQRINTAVRLLSHSQAASIRPTVLDEEPAVRLKAAPQVKTRKTVLALVADGLPPETVVDVSIRRLGPKKTKYADLSRIRTDSEGLVALPVVKLKKGARYVISLRDLDSDTTRYLKVRIAGKKK